MLGERKLYKEHEKNLCSNLSHCRTCTVRLATFKRHSELLQEHDQVLRDNKRGEEGPHVTSHLIQTDTTVWFDALRLENWWQPANMAANLLGLECSAPDLCSARFPVDPQGPSLVAPYLYAALLMAASGVDE